MRSGFLPALLATTLVATACSHALEEGPLGGPGAETSICTPAKDDYAIIGADPLRNRGESPLTIKSVELVDAKGLTLDAAYIVVLGGGVGSLGGAAPKPDDSSYDSWLEREQAEGATIPGNEARDLLLVLRAVGDGDEHSAKDIEIIYQDDSGKDYRLTNEAALELVTSRRCMA